MRTPTLAAPVRPTLADSLRLIENPPNARRTMEALREMGYNSYASILDIIDNSIDAGASRIRIGVTSRAGDIIIEIEDDGCGMNEEILSEALRLGSDTSRETGDLGKFGMGLVTASIGLSQRVEVFTKEEGGIPLYGAFDLEVIASEDRFVKWVGEASPEQAKYCPEPKGTLVRLSKTDRISNRNTSEFTNKLVKEAGQVFRKFIKASLRIEVNRRDVPPIDPLMLSDPNTRLVLETEIPVDGNGSATVRVVDLPDYGQAGNKAHEIIPQDSGFYVVRNNREIMAAHTFDFYKKHADYSHFRAEICFDGSLDSYFHTDVKKMSIHPSQSFLDKLRQATTQLIQESGRQARGRANVGKGQIDHSTAEANITRRAPLIPKPKALLERRTHKGGEGTHAAGNGASSRTPHLTDLKTISGLRVEFDEGNYGEGPFYAVHQEGRTIRITYNREHPFWRELIDLAESPKVVATLDYLVFALANAELLVPEQASIVKANVNATLVGLLV